MTSRFTTRQLNGATALLRELAGTGTSRRPAIGATPNAGTTATAPGELDLRPTLRYGSRGVAVSGVQRRLNQLGATLAEDSIMGPKTVAVVQAFQRQHGLVVDGVVGPKTWKQFDDLALQLLQSSLPAPAAASGMVGASADAIPPPGLGLDQLPLELRETLARSFRDRKARQPETLPSRGPNGEYFAGNLDNGFTPNPAKGYSGNPATVWEALLHVHLADLNTLRQVFDRWTATGLDWNLVKYIRNIWTFTSRGIKFKCTDNGALKSGLNRSRGFCEEHPIPALWTEHQGQNTWREIVRSSGPGIHVCLGPDTLALPNDAHIDWHSPAMQQGPVGFCTYDPVQAQLHWADLRNERVLSPYERLDSKRDGAGKIVRLGIFDSARTGIRKARAAAPSKQAIIDAVEAAVDQIEVQARDVGRACRGAAGEAEVARLLDSIPAAVRPLANLRG